MIVQWIPEQNNHTIAYKTLVARAVIGAAEYN
jgi:hypothetical protein